MRALRMQTIAGFGIDKVADAAATDPAILRMENLDTDLSPPPGVMEATRRAMERPEYNSWLPFSGRDDMKRAVADHVAVRSGVRYEPTSEVAITTSDGSS